MMKLGVYFSSVVHPLNLIININSSVHIPDSLQVLTHTEQNRRSNKQTIEIPTDKNHNTEIAAKRGNTTILNLDKNTPQHKHALSHNSSEFITLLQDQDPNFSKPWDEISSMNFLSSSSLIFGLDFDNPLLVLRNNSVRQILCMRVKDKLKYNITK